MVALGDGSAFLFYFEKWTVGVSTSGRPVTFDTSLARIFIAIDEDHDW